MGEHQHDHSTQTLADSTNECSIEALQKCLREKASSEWFKNKPEMLSIFDEFIKTPKQIDLTRKYEGQRDEKKGLDSLRGLALENKVVTEKDNSLDRGNNFGMEMKKSNSNEKPKIKKVTRKQKKKNITSEETSSNETVAVPSLSNLEIPSEIVPINNLENNSKQIREEFLVEKIDETQKHEKVTKQGKKNNSPSKSNKTKQDKKRKQKKDDRSAHKKFKVMEPKEPLVKDFCKFFLHGNCHKGDSCPFSHDKKTFPCKFFHLYNSCKKGDSCDFSHHTPLSDAYRQLLMNTEKKFAQEPAKEESSNPNPIPFPQFENLQQSPSFTLNNSTITSSNPSFPLPGSSSIPFPTTFSSNLEENFTPTDPTPELTTNTQPIIPITSSPSLPFTNPFSNPFIHPNNY